MKNRGGNLLLRARKKKTDLGYRLFFPRPRIVQIAGGGAGDSEKKTAKSGFPSRGSQGLELVRRLASCGAIQIYAVKTYQLRGVEGWEL